MKKVLTRGFAAIIAVFMLLAGTTAQAAPAKASDPNAIPEVTVISRSGSIETGRIVFSSTEPLGEDLPPILRGPSTDPIWICEGTPTSYTIGKGVRLDTCRGYRLKKYLNGKLLLNIPITAAGTPAKNLTRKDVVCIFGVVSGMYGVLTATGWGYVVAGIFAGGGVAASCRA